MPDLSKLARQAETHEELLAGSVARFAQANGLDDIALAERLGCTPEGLTRLKLCRVPRDAAGITQIAEYTGCNAEALVFLLNPD